MVVVVVVIVVVIPLHPYSFIAAPSSDAAKGGDVRTQYDGGVSYVPSLSLLQHVQYLPELASDSRCLNG